MEILIIALVTWFACGLVASAMFESRGHSGCSGFALGFLFGPLGILIAAVTPSTQETLQQNQRALDSRRLVRGELKKCPYCAELVKREAIVCRYCGKDLTTRPSGPVALGMATRTDVATSSPTTTCHKCGTENKTEDKFCVMCGEPLVIAGPNVVTREAERRAAAASELQNIQPSGQPELLPPTPQGTGGKRAWVGLAILGAILLGGLVIFVCMGLAWVLLSPSLATMRTAEPSLATVTRLAVFSLNPTVAPTSMPAPSPSPAMSPTRTNTPRPTQPRPTPTPRPAGYARSNPIPLGKAVLWTGYFGEQLRITLLQVYRGQEAWNRIKVANHNNVPPPSGSEYFLFRVRAEAVKSGRDPSIVLGDSDFVVVASDVKEYLTFQGPTIVPPDPQFLGMIYPGGSLEGWVALTVTAGDPHPLLAYGQAIIDSEMRVWLDTK